MRHGSRARLAAVGIVTSGALLLAGCGAANESGSAGGQGGGSNLSGAIAGAGSSAQQAAQTAWIAGFTGANPGVTVNYEPSGSGAGRTQFAAGGVPFAGSDAYLEGDQLAQAKQRCGEVVELPVYVSPIAVVYNLPGVDNLKLAPATTAGIFNRQITKWNAPEIAADNPGVALPDQAITPVNRSDESGTTENFTEYLAAAAGPAWPHEPDGNWPVAGGEAAQGTSGVVGAVTAGAGTIGYADESQAGDLGKVQVKVGNEFVAPTPEAAAAVLDASKRVEGQGQYSYAFDLARDTTASGTYPIVLVSYVLACAKYADAAQADLVKAYLTYITSAEGQQAAAQAAGSAPISDNLRGQITPAVEAISAGA
nr:phosphate ABC transporter substrate-binding protein PstS [Pseudonocardia sp. H11422]